MSSGILTFHAAYNYGAFLQALGLHQFLTSLGHEVRVIGYENSVMKTFHERCLYARRDPFILAAHWKKKQRFLKARRQLLPQTPATTNLNDVPWHEFDAVVYGSDEIWNWQTHNHGFDSAFFGRGADNLKKIAYAPSLGANHLYAEPSAEVAAGILDFNSVSARDNETRKMIQSILPQQEIQLVADPVFLSDFENCFANSKFTSRRYIAVYGDFPSLHVRSTLRQWATKQNMPLVSIGNHHRWCHKNWASAGPLNFLTFMRDAAFVVTNTFHGTMFAVKFSRPFATIRQPDSREKFRPFVDLIGQWSRFCDPEFLSIEVLESLASTDFDASALDTLIQQSKGFLKASLEPAKKCS